MWIGFPRTWINPHLCPFKKSNYAFHRQSTLWLSFFNCFESFRASGFVKYLDKKLTLMHSHTHIKDLTCVNSLDITKGLKTRSRKVLNETKESTIDFFVVCEHVLPFVTKMEIDNHKNHTLTNFKQGEDSVNSDHLPLVMNDTFLSNEAGK